MREEGVAVVGQGNLIGREDIRRASDKTTVGVHGVQAPSNEFPEGVGEGVDCMKVGRGGHVETEAEAGRLSKHSRSGHRIRKQGEEIKGRQLLGFMLGNYITRETYVRRMCGGRAYRCRGCTGTFIRLMSLVTRTRSGA